MAGKMELWTQSSESRFSEYVEALATVLRREDRAGPFKDYCTGLLMPGERKSVEPMAAIIAPARVSAKHQSLLHLVGQAAWSDEAVVAKARELVLPAIEAQGDRGLDCRRHGLRQERRSFSGRRPAILRAARQDRQLSDRGDAFDRQSCVEPADCLSALSAGRLGCGRSPAQGGWCPGRRDIPDQTRDRPRSDQGRPRSGRRSGRPADRCRLWGRRRVPLRRNSQRFDLCGWRAIDAQRLAAWRRTAAAQTLERTRPPAIAYAPRRRAYPCFRQDAGAGASRGGLAHRSMAGGL